MQESRLDWGWSPAAAAELPIPSGRRSSLVFEDAQVEVRFYAPRGQDDQTPHERDEIYVIAGGTATFIRESEQRPVSRGDLVQVPAGMEHRFVDLSDDFGTWVVFYGHTR
jgi:mannose-6-phosphate isomerase-like protein (cupin superfamily)